MRILLAEDTEADALLSADFLRREGHEVDICDRRNRAIQLLAEKQYDVAVVDLILVASTGDTVIQAASKAGLGVVAISASDRSMEDLKATLDLMGVKIHASLKKPFSLRMLLVAVEYAYGQKMQPPQLPATNEG